MAVWWENNTHELRVTGLKDATRDEYINAGAGVTVQATVYDAETGDDAPLDTGSWPQALTYEAGSNGVWTLTLDGVTLDPAKTWRVRLEGSDANNNDFEWDEDVAVKRRTFSDLT